MSLGRIFEQITKNHDSYRSKLERVISNLDQEKGLNQSDKLDRVLFHIIEEIIEARRTYPHKFWKQSDEETHTDLLLEELADVFLMLRSAYLEACKLANVTEQQFLETILKKTGVNNERIKQGY